MARHATGYLIAATRRPVQMEGPCSNIPALKSSRTLDEVTYSIPGFGIELKYMQGTPICGRRSLDCRQDLGKSSGVFRDGKKPVCAAGVSSAAVVARSYQDIGELQEKGDLCAHRIVALGKIADHGVRRWILCEKGIQRLQAVLRAVRWRDGPMGRPSRTDWLRHPKICRDFRSFGIISHNSAPGLAGILLFPTVRLAHCTG